MTGGQLCCMGCGDSVDRDVAKKRPADGSPRCPACAKDYFPDYS